MKALGKNCEENVKAIKSILTSEDILVYRFKSGDGAACAAVYTDGLTDKALLGEQVARPLLSSPSPKSIQEAAGMLLSPETKAVDSPEGAAEEILAGNPVIVIDGMRGALAAGLKKLTMRAIMEPPGAFAVKGPREGFIEDIKTNMSLVRNRLRTPKLQFKMLKAGRQSGTAIAVGFLEGIANAEIVEKICSRIEQIDTDAILDSSYVAKFLAERPLSLFKPAGTTESEHANTNPHCPAVSGVSANAARRIGTAHKSTFTPMPIKTVRNSILLPKNPFPKAESVSERILKEWNNSKNDSTKNVTVTATALPQRAFAYKKANRTAAV